MKLSKKKLLFTFIIITQQQRERMVLHGSKEQKLANNIFVPTTTNEIAHAWKRIDEFNQRKLRFPIFPLAWWKHLERDKEIQQLVRYSVLLETVSDTPLPPHFPSNYSRTRLQQAKELSNTVSTIRPFPPPRPSSRSIVPSGCAKTKPNHGSISRARIK